jgi:CheY-like chemotaxis protein
LVDLPVDAKIDLLFLDSRLSSSMSAQDVVRRLKNTFTSIPIIVLSELQWMPDDMRGYADDFVNKGDPKGLIETIAAVLQVSTFSTKESHLTFRENGYSNCSAHRR